jgi:hypothetical protein
MAVSDELGHRRLRSADEGVIHRLVLLAQPDHFKHACLLAATAIVRQRER